MRGYICCLLLIGCTLSASHLVDPALASNNKCNFLAKVGECTSMRNLGGGSLANQSQIASGAQPSHSSNGFQSELDAFRDKIQNAWIIPIGSPTGLVITVHIKLSEAKTLSGPPSILISGDRKSLPDGELKVLESSILKAIVGCQPFDMFTHDTYDDWKDMQLTFTT